MSPEGIMLCFCFGHITMSIRLISVDLLTRSAFFGTPRILKSFELPIFSAPQSRGRIARAVETENHLFLRKQIITLSPTAHIKLTPLYTPSPIASHSCLQTYRFSLKVCCTALAPMTSCLVKLTRLPSSSVMLLPLGPWW
jgi:hypothetical protein